MPRRIIKLTLVGGVAAVVVSASFVGATLFFPRTSHAQLSITVTDLGTLPGGAFSYASDINQLGEIVGWCNTSAGTQQAIYWSGSGAAPVALQNLPGGTYSHAFSINDSGQIVGDSNDSSGNGHAVMWPSATSAPIPLENLVADNFSLPFNQ